MKTVCIVQARLGSKRLPRKVLLPLNGHTVIGEVLARCIRVAGVDEVVCAIPYDEWELEREASKYCSVIFGPEDDVLTRYKVAAAVTRADQVMRITGDCPLICPDLCAAVLALHLRTCSDYTCNILPFRTFPKGLDCEVFSQDALVAAYAHSAANPYDQEHVTPWMQRAQRNLKRENFISPWLMDGRLCLDTEDDYKVICAAFGHEPYQRLHAA